MLVIFGVQNNRIATFYSTQIRINIRHDDVSVKVNHSRLADR